MQTLFGYFPSRARKRIELGLPLDAFVLISVGELNRNKNNCVVIAALEKLKNKNIHYVLCGIGDQDIALKTQADQAGLQDHIHFLGYRSNVKEIYEMADCFVMPSYREGLSRALMEAMASGLPCIVSKIRGNVDLVKDGEGGIICDRNSCSEYANAIKRVYSEKNTHTRMGDYNREKIKAYDVANVKKEIATIYEGILEER